MRQKVMTTAAAVALALGFPFGALGTTINLDFNGNTAAGPHDAFAGEMDVADAEIQAGLFGAGGSSVRTGFNNESSAEASAAQYDALNPSDDIWLTTADPGFGDNAFIQFVFDTGLSALDIPNIDSIDLSVEGLQGATTDDWYVFAWDYTNGTYLRLNASGDGVNGADEIRSGFLQDGYLGGDGDTLVDVSDLVSASGQLTVVAVNQDTSDTIRVDNVTVAIEVVPEPGIALLLGLGLLGLAGGGRIRHG